MSWHCNVRSHSRRSLAGARCPRCPGVSRPSLTPRGVSAVDHVCPDAGSGLLATYEQWRGHADGQACCDYGLSVDIPRWHESLREELEALVKDKGKGRGSPAGAGVTAGPPGTQRCGDTQRGHAPSSELGPPHPWPSRRELWVGTLAPGSCHNIGVCALAFGQLAAWTWKGILETKGVRLATLT